MPRGVVSPPPHRCPPCLSPPWQLCWLLWSRPGHPPAKGAPKAPGERGTPPAKSAPAGGSGALSHQCCPQPYWQPWWDSDSPAGGISGGTAVPGGAGSAVRAGYSLRKIRLLLLAGMSTWKHRGGVRAAHRHGEHPRAHHLPSSLGTARWPRPAPAAAPCPAAPRRDCCGEGGVGHTRGHPPQSIPTSQGRPRLRGCPQALLISKDHAGRELPAAAGAGAGHRGQDGPPAA